MAVGISDFSDSRRCDVLLSHVAYCCHSRCSSTCAIYYKRSVHSVLVPASRRDRDKHGIDQVDLILVGWTCTHGM